MRRIYYGVGTQYTTDGHVITPDQAKQWREHSERIMSDTFGGATTYATSGSWIGPNGDLVHEPGLGLEAYSDATDSAIQAVASQLRRLWHQHTVMVAVQPVQQVTFYDGASEADIASDTYPEVAA